MAHFLMAFDSIDKNLTGQISLLDVKKYSEVENCNKNFLENFFNLFDLNSDGIITLEEYCTALGISGRNKDKILLRRARRKSSVVFSEIANQMIRKNMEVFCSDMDNGDQAHVIEICHDIFADHRDKSDIAENLKFKLDEEFGEHWHVIVGTGKYGSSITNEESRLLHFKMNGFAFLIWRSNV